MPLSKVLNLEVGETLILNANAESPVQIKCGAIPLTTATPAPASPAARLRATVLAYGDAPRDPTMATDGCSKTPESPRTHSTGGGSATIRSQAG